MTGGLLWGRHANPAWLRPRLLHLKRYEVAFIFNLFEEVEPRLGALISGHTCAGSSSIT